MSTDKTYLAYILDQLSFAAKDIATRPMMGEYLLYYRGKLIGGLYDNRLLVKPTPSVCALVPDAHLEHPYPGAKPLLLVESTDTPSLLAELLAALDADLSATGRKRSSAS